MMLFASGIRFGIGRSWPHMLGVAFGYTGLLIASGFGLGSILESWPQVHFGFRMVAAAYLFLLALQIGLTGWVRRKSEPAPAFQANAAPNPRHLQGRWAGWVSAFALIRSSRFWPTAPSLRPISFVGATLFQVINPKAWTLALSVIVAYGGQDPAASALGLQTSLGSLPSFLWAVVLVAGGFHALGVWAWVILGRSLGEVLSDARRARWIYAIVGGR